MKREDPQQQRVYLAEQESGLVGERFSKVNEVQEYVDLVLGTTWWRKNYPLVDHVEIRNGRGWRRGWSEGPKLAHVHGASRPGIIALPRPTRFERYVLHELAHVINPWYATHHGPEYVSGYLALVGRFMGPGPEGILRASFQNFDVACVAVGC